MSRQSTKRKKLQRAKQQMSGMTSYNNSAIQQQIQQMLAKVQTGPGNVLYSPGIPLQPQPGVNPDGQPRQWSFPISINTSGVDRAYGNPDIPSFKQLRMLSKLYSGITLPERVWLDMIHGLHLNITLKPELKAQGMDDKDADIQKSISNILTFFECPDRVHDHHSWLKMMVRDQTQVDEMYLYKRRARDGSLYALEVTAGDTIKPLLDDWGRIPEPPLYAYQQFPWGIPGDQYTTEDLIHYQETPQTDSAYGFGRVERFMMEVNQALRKKKRDLSMFTEGNIPAGIMEVPESANWTPDQIDAYEQLWNALIAGNVQQQVRVKFTQPGMKYIKTDTGDILTDFDYFLYKISCGVYGISLADIGFVEDIHKSSDQGQQNMMYRRTLKPIVTTYAQIITRIIREEFHEDRLEANYGGYEEEEDFNTQATGLATLANIGAIAPSDIAHIMKLPDVPKTGAFIMTKTGPFFLKDYEEGSDLRAAQTQATMAGMQLAANPQPDEEDNEEQPASDTQKDEKPPSGKAGPQKQDKPKEEEKESGGNDQKEKPATKDNNLKRAVEATEDERILSDEYRKWRMCALSDIKRGRRVRYFSSVIIPEEIHTHVTHELERATSTEQVKDIFRAASSDESYNWQKHDESVQKSLATMRNKGVKKLKWVQHSNECDICSQNNGRVVELGELFPSLVYTVPGHPNCICDIEEIYE